MRHTRAKTARLAGRSAARRTPLAPCTLAATQGDCVIVEAMVQQRISAGIPPHSAHSLTLPFYRVSGQGFWWVVLVSSCSNPKLDFTCLQAFFTPIQDAMENDLWKMSAVEVVQLLRQGKVISMGCKASTLQTSRYSLVILPHR